MGGGEDNKDREGEREAEIRLKSNCQGNDLQGCIEPMKPPYVNTSADHSSTDRT